MTHDGEGWALHPHRALPADPTIRAIATTVYDATRTLPIVSMHGHVEVEMLAADAPFTNPADVLIVPDHYVVRMLVSQGVPHVSVGPLKDAGERDPRDVWRTFCSHWHVFRGTPTRFWFEHVLIEVLGVTERPSAESADRLYDHICERFESPELRPLALLDRFNLEILATTDHATAPLAEHAILAERGLGERVVPTFRPDLLLQVDARHWQADIGLLSQRADVEVDTYPTFLDALRRRRRAFIEAGARATDHGHFSAHIEPMSDADAARTFADAMRGEVTPTQAQAFVGHMLFEMARMSTEDGLTMQLRTGVLRNHSSQMHEQAGQDLGYDIPVAAEFTTNLRPLLEAFGHHPQLRFIVFTVDETVYSRELAPLAGVYPSMKLGAPWWFLDTPDAMRRFREAVTDTAGFYNTTGFVDDTRAYFSIPARHDLSRRIDASFLARLVAEHRLGLDEAVETAVDLAYRLPQQNYPPTR